MNAAESALVVSQLLGLALNLLVRAQEVSDLVSAAQQQGRDLTQEEIDKVIEAREAARAAAVAATQ